MSDDDTTDTDDSDEEEPIPAFDPDESEDATGATGDPSGDDDRSGVEPVDLFEDPDADETPRIDEGDVEALEGETADPLDDVAQRVRKRRDEESGEYDDLFEEYDAAEVDSDALWEQIRSDEPVGIDADEVGESHERVVEKSSYCEKCEYFSEPPEMHCTHDGTEIVELVDMDSVRVRNCPVVQEEERLETIRDEE